MTAGHQKRVAFVIPALDEAASIGGVVLGLLPLGQPIVVDDGSSDWNGDVARDHGALVEVHPYNMGYDAALASGLRLAIERGFDFAVTLDADGQHVTSSAQGFIRELSEGADLVVGVRDRLQRWSEVVFAHVGRLAWGLRDPLCGLKGYRLSSLRTLPVEPSYPSVGTELAIRAVRAGMAVREVQVATRPRRGTSRFGSGLRANLRIIRALLQGLLLDTRGSPSGGEV